LTPRSGESKLSTTIRGISAVSRGNFRFGERLMKTNYLAVLVAAIVYWLLGAVWYGFVFKNAWMTLENINVAQAKAMNPFIPFLITIGLNLLIAFVLAQLCLWRNAATASRGAALGILIWIGFVGPITLTTHIYEMRPLQLFALNQFYPLVGLCVMGAILGAWTKKPAPSA
jgi:Protein of unknown function (DUF1761)